MRLFRLGRAALDAERLYLRRLARSRATQAGLGAAAAVFGLLLLVMLHIAAFAALLEPWGAVQAALAVAAGDLVVLLALAFAARHAGRDPVAEEALLLRDSLLRRMREEAGPALLLAPLLRGVRGGGRPGLLRTVIAALLAGLLSRR